MKKFNEFKSLANLVNYKKLDRKSKIQIKGGLADPDRQHIPGNPSGCHSNC